MKVWNSVKRRIAAVWLGMILMAPGLAVANMLMPGIDLGVSRQELEKRFVLVPLGVDGITRSLATWKTTPAQPIVGTIPSMELIFDSDDRLEALYIPVVRLDYDVLINGVTKDLVVISHIISDDLEAFLVDDGGDVLLLREKGRSPSIMMSSHRYMDATVQFLMEQIHLKVHGAHN